MRRRNGFLGITILVSAIAMSGCGKRDSREAAPEVVHDVKVETISFHAIPDEIEASGTVEPAAAAQVSAQTMGTVAQVLVREGDRVRRGQLLVRLDGREQDARLMAAASARAEAVAAVEEAQGVVAGAQAQEEVAKKTLDRFAYLQARDSVSSQEFDEVEGRYRAAREGLAQARASRDRAVAMRSRAESELAASEALAAYARVIAQFDGTVARRFVEPGSVVMPGSPLLVVEDVSRYLMEVTLNASSAGLIGRGSEARLRVDALPGREFRGRVIELETAGDPGSQTLRAKIDLPADAALRSGWFGRAWFRLAEKQALTVPKTAVVERGQLRGVYALDVHQVARFRLVSLGREVSDRVEVLAGLAPGDRILQAPGPRALEGLKVEAP